MSAILRFLFSFEGRLSHKDFWLFYLLPFYVPVIVAFIFMGGAVYPASAVFDVSYVMLPYLVLWAWPSWAIYSRRFHDSGVSAQWAIGLNIAAFVSFALSYGAFADLFSALHQSGAAPAPLPDLMRLGLIGAVLLFALSLVALIYLGWLAPGEKGENGFGPDPLETPNAAGA